ncbi:MAG: hypothetical protein WAX67_11235 [Rugosibacter sp.]
MTQTLPAGFDDLERYVAGWALDSELLRNRKRISSTMGEITEFYKVMLARMKAVTTHLDQHSIDSLPPAEVKLLNLALMFMEVSPAVELFNQPTVPDAFPMERFEILQP